MGIQKELEKLQTIINNHKKDKLIQIKFYIKERELKNKIKKS